MHLLRRQSQLLLLDRWNAMRTASYWIVLLLLVLGDQAMVASLNTFGRYISSPLSFIRSSPPLILSFVGCVYSWMDHRIKIKSQLPLSAILASSPCVSPPTSSVRFNHIVTCVKHHVVSSRSESTRSQRNVHTTVMHAISCSDYMHPYPISRPFPALKNHRKIPNHHNQMIL